MIKSRQMNICHPEILPFMVGHFYHVRVEKLDRNSTMTQNIIKDL